MDPNPQLENQHLIYDSVIDLTLRYRPNLKSQALSHFQFLSACLNSKIIPNGLHIKKDVCALTKGVDNNIIKQLKCRWYRILSNSSIQLARALRDYYGKIYNTTPSEYNIDLYDRCTRRKCKKLSSLSNRYVNVKELANIEHHPNRRFNKRKSRRQNFVHNPDQYLKNISDRHLTEDQKTVLALGLNFNVGQREFARKILLESIRQTCVKCFDSIENHDDKVKAINYMGESLFNQYREIKPNKEYKSILPLNLLRALKSLRAMEDVVITPADKGGKVVIWSRESYIKEGLRHLQSDVYVAAVDDDLVIANESVSAILAKGVFENIL
ncbi:hypothetical protein GJ496_008265, partial [Pomphorhynchus laevis]